MEPFQLREEQQRQLKADLPPPLNPESSNDPRIKFNSELNEYTMTGEDGVSLVWEPNKHAWFPMYQEDLISQQQSIYETPMDISTVDSADGPQEKKKKPPKVSQHPVVKISQSSIYITNLPLDVTTAEVEEYFSKCGLILPDVDSGKPRIKIYIDPETGAPKGDCLLTYFKPESVDLAITILDETEFRPGFRISIEKAKFEEKEGRQEKPSGPAFGPRLNKDKKRKMEAAIKRLERQLDWADEKKVDKRAKKAARTVVLNHMFRPHEFDQDPSLILDLKDEIREECEKLGGVTSITVYDKNQDGIVAVRFNEEISAEACVKLMNGRFFDGRVVEAKIYDGVTKYGMTDKQETEEDEKVRLARYEKWLEAGGKGEFPDNLANEADSDSEAEVAHLATKIMHGDDDDDDIGDIGASVFASSGVNSSKQPLDEKQKLIEEEESYFNSADEQGPVGQNMAPAVKEAPKVKRPVETNPAEHSSSTEDESTPDKPKRKRTKRK